jgi:hypothetical protein
VGLGCAILLAPLSFAIDHFFEVDLSGKWIEIGAPVLASLIGVALASWTMNADPNLWLAPAVVAAAASLILLFRGMGSRRCALCNRRIGSGVAFDCPRCGLLVCEQHCWSFDHGRCKLCEQNRVPAFSPDGRWWDKQFGPRYSYGRCQLCLTAATETDLRACGKCGHPQCRDCWDYSNGQCSRCKWTVEDLPEALRNFVLTPARTERSPAGRPARR